MVRIHPTPLVVKILWARSSIGFGQLLCKHQGPGMVVGEHPVWKERP